MVIRTSVVNERHRTDRRNVGGRAAASGSLKVYGIVFVSLIVLLTKQVPFVHYHSTMKGMSFNIPYNQTVAKLQHNNNNNSDSSSSSSSNVMSWNKISSSPSSLFEEKRRGQQEGSTPNYSAKICAVVKNEESYLEEWLDYYRALGFDHVYIYDNSESFDLQYFPQWYESRLHHSTGLGTYEPKPLSSRTDVIADNMTLINTYNVNETSSHFLTVIHHPGWRKFFQESTYNECAVRVRRETPKTERKRVWIAFYDPDEFLVLRNQSNIHSFLDKYNRRGGGSIQINWLVFGTSEQIQSNLSEPVTYRFTYRNEKPDIGTKAIVHLPDLVKMKVHMPERVRNYVYSPNGIVFKRPGKVHKYCCNKNGAVDVAAIFHFKTKSREEYTMKKCNKTRVSSGKVKKNCMDEIFSGYIFDDTAWEFLRTTLPEKYGHFGMASPLRRTIGTNDTLIAKESMR